MTAPDTRGRCHAPAVRAQAERLGVDLGTVDGTGAGGRVTLADVAAAATPQHAPAPRPLHPQAPSVDARVQREYEARRLEQARDFDAYLDLFGEPVPGERPLPVVTAARRPIRVSSQFNNRAEVVIDAAGRNPLLEDAAQSNPTCYELALADGNPPPTVFNSGDLPAFTASGLPPEVLLELPWNVRHFAASAESRATVLDMIERFAENPGDGIPGVDDEYHHPGAQQYVARMQAWLVGPGEDLDKSAD